MLRFFFTPMFLLLMVSTTFATPKVLEHQGQVTGSDNTPVSGVVNVTFKLYSSASGGSPVWTQSMPVSFDYGFYSVELGPGTPELSEELFDTSDLYLGVTLEDQDEFVPRHHLVSVPYCFQAWSVTGEVNALNGLYVNGEELVDSSGNMTVTGALTTNGPITLPQSELSELPSASDSNRGQLYYVTDEDVFYYSNGSEWINISSGGSGGDIPLPNIVSVSPSQIAPEQDVTLTLEGLKFEDGIEVEIDGTPVTGVTFVSASQIEFSTGTTLTAGSYDIRVTNPSGLRDTLVGGLSVDELPTWTTPEGDLGSIIDTAVGEHMTLEAEDGEGPVTFAVIEGTFPPGLSLAPDTGVIYGDPDDVSNSVEYTFTVAITDTAPEPNSVSQNFSLTITHSQGQSPDSSGDTCKQLLADDSSSESGLYWLDPDGDGSAEPFQTYCDMESYGGGWTLLARMTNGCNTYSRDAIGTLTAPDQSDCAKLSDANINLLRTNSTSNGVFWGWHDGGPYEMGGPRFMMIMVGEFNAYDTQSNLIQRCSCTPDGPWSANYDYTSTMAGVYNHNGGWKCVTVGQDGCTSENTTTSDLFLYQHTLRQAGTFPSNSHGVPGGLPGYLFIR